MWFRFVHNDGQCFLPNAILEDSSLCLVCSLAFYFTLAWTLRVLCQRPSCSEADTEQDDPLFWRPVEYKLRWAVTWTVWSGAGAEAGPGRTGPTSAGPDRTMTHASEVPHQEPQDAHLSWDRLFSQSGNPFLSFLLFIFHLSVIGSE